MQNFFITILLLLSFNISADDHISISAKTFLHQDQQILAISFENEKDWHTYWKNPGSAGQPPQFEFKKGNTALELIAMEWPAPKIFQEAEDLIAYGHEGHNIFFFQVPKPLQGSDINITTSWLICKDICIPGQHELKLKLDNQSSYGPTNLSSNILTSALEVLPQDQDIPKNLNLYMAKIDGENKLALQFTLTNVNLADINLNHNILLPFPNELLDIKNEELYWNEETKTIYGRILIDWDGNYQEPPVEFPQDGQFLRPLELKFLHFPHNSEKAIIYTKSFDAFSLTGEKALNDYLKTLPRLYHTYENKNVVQNNHIDETVTTSLVLYLMFAFLGGLILNLMPCVLPVISLKLFGLILHSDESAKKILKHNLVYTLGVLSSFWVLATAIIVLKASGEKIGWGFQLQSPVFVFIMMAILLIMAMNMLGLFEFKTPGGKALGSVQLKKGTSGDFINGVLATILSTPCSAPFLGTALTFAFTSSIFTIFLVFTMIGLGLSFPFILTGLFPQLIRFFPRPGLWMEKLKYVLGFSLILTFVWLYDVLTNIIDMQYSNFFINLFFTILFICIFTWQKIKSGKIIGLILAALVAMSFGYIWRNNHLKEGQNLAALPQNKSLNWKAWSLDEMQALQNEKRWVFIDFTAQWCLTCKVNKKIVLETEAFTKLTKKHHLALLIGDWTKRDNNITDFLKSYNIVGVPAYFIQTPEGKVHYLGETISISKIESYLK